MAKPILISGIQPSGRLHIGNYLGALKNFVELQNSGKYECLFFVADLHALTEPFEGKHVPPLMADFLAAGLDPKKSMLFVQSMAPQTTELAWIFSTLTPMGELERMTQFKEKGENKARENVGLFTYPVLMAADVALYDAALVPVGEDQLQHLELARELVRKFNNKYGETFVEPKPLLTKTPRIMSLNDPEKKMSKSVPHGCLFLDDAEGAVRDKIMRAITDSGSEVKYDKEEKPGLSNLMAIYAGLVGKSMEDVEREFAGKDYGTFKSAVADAAVAALAPFRADKTVLAKKVKTAFAAGGKKVNAKAEKKMKAVKKAVGFL